MSEHISRIQKERLANAIALTLYTMVNGWLEHGDAQFQDRWIYSEILINMEKKNFEEELKAKCAYLDDVLCELHKSDAVMKEFTDKRDILGVELWSGAAMLMVDGYKSHLLQAIVLMEEIRSFINNDNSVSDLKTQMLDQIGSWLSWCRDEYERNKKVSDMVKQLNKRKV